MKNIKFLIGVDPCDGCYYQCNEYYFEADQGHWVLKSICEKKLAFKIDA